jgi:8-oxo-dGTP pyrophosphatase MutT (NUDIX family)
MTDQRTRTLLGWLGKIVTVTLDTEADTACPRSGYVRGGAGCGKNRAYLLGVANCGASYTGKVISVLRRYAEGSDKLIVAPVGVEIYEPWIRAAIEAREPMEGARLFCLYEKSCGVIPYRVRNRHLEYLALFQSGSSTWSFPKGHMEYGEEELDTARREVEEEIGVRLDISQDFRCEICYSVHNRHSKKKVVLFAVPFDGEVFLREGEIGDSKWLTRAEIQKLFGHRELRGIFSRLEKKLAEEQR